MGQHQQDQDELAPLLVPISCQSHHRAGNDSREGRADESDRRDDAAAQAELGHRAERPVRVARLEPVVLVVDRRLHVGDRGQLLGLVEEKWTLQIELPDHLDDWSEWMRELGRRYRRNAHAHPHVARLISVERVRNINAMRIPDAVLGKVADAYLVPDNHLGRATVSSLAVAREVAAMGGRAIANGADVADWGQVEGLVSRGQGARRVAADALERGHVALRYQPAHVRDEAIEPGQDLRAGPRVAGLGQRGPGDARVCRDRWSQAGVGRRRALAQLRRRRGDV